MANTHPFLAEVFRVLGNAPVQLETARFQHFSLNGKPGDKAGWSLLFANGLTGIFGDFRAGTSHFWRAKPTRSMSQAERVEMLERVRLARSRHAMNLRDRQASNESVIKSIWSETVPITVGDPASSYLDRRGLVGPIPTILRLHRNLRHWDSDTHSDFGCWPAMVAPLIHPDGRMLALHRTYLSADGYKAPVPTVKKLTGTAGPLAGACIPLHAPRDGVIGIAEGIETALAAHLASGIPTVAAYCSSNLAAYIWPPEVVRIVVFADADKAGMCAALALKARATSAKVSAVILTPSVPGCDWADVWASRAFVDRGEAA